MRRSIRCLLVQVTIAVCSLLASPAQGEAQVLVAGTESVTAVFSAGERIFGYDSALKSLRIFSPRGSTLEEVASLPMAGTVTDVAVIPNGYVVATGMGRENPAASARVEAITGANSTRQVIFERSGERNQINSVIWRDGKLWISFFTSKYITTIGYLIPTTDGPWTFHESASIRMGDSLDVVGELAFVGRSYGDMQGQDGDLVLLRGSERTLLPSYRGVRSVRVIGDASNHKIFIGDGWHMNYGQLAQARLSVLSKRKEDSRYSLQIIDYDKEATDFRRLQPLHSAGRDYIVALGSSSVVMYDQRDGSSKKVLYSRNIQGALIDAVVAQVAADKAIVVVADQGMRVLEV